MWRSPAQTTEVRLDEKWAFVANKGAQCDRSDPADDHEGDYWDHLALDPEGHLAVAVVPSARTIENTEALVEEFRRRTGGRLVGLMTSDDHPAYETAILNAYGETATPPRTGKPGRPVAPHKVPPPGLNYAVDAKRREKGRVVEVGTRDVFGTTAASKRTGRTAATPGRPARRTVSRRIGGVTRPSPAGARIVTTSAGRCGRRRSWVPRAIVGDEVRRRRRG